MKFRMILAALLLPGLAAAQQSADKSVSGQNTPRPYRVSVALQADARAKNEPPATITQKDLDWVDISPDLPVLLSAGDTSPAAVTLLPGQSNMRVNLNLRNAPFKEAIKQLTEQTKQEFVLEKDVPADTRVTVVAKNIRLSTALDVLTDATGLNWNHQTVKKTDAKEAGFVFHIGKKVSRNLVYQWWNHNLPSMNSWNLQNDNYNTNGIQNNRIFFNDVAPRIQWNSNQRIRVNPQKPGDPPLLQGGRIIEKGALPDPLVNTKTLNGDVLFLPGNGINLTNPYSTLGSTLIRTSDATEVRSTFTCPHCKQQVTVIHQHQAPKCDTCGRVFHDDWQFCPFDGAKRPANASSDWQFCPICGKSIKPDSKPDSKPGN